MAIKDWQQAERPREKLLQRGAGALSDAELLAIFLRTGGRGKTAVDLARELIGHSGGLRQLLREDPSALRKHKGLGSAKIAQIGALAEISRRVTEHQVERGEPLTSPATTRRYLEIQLRDYGQEVFACLLLDNRHRVIAFEELFHGTINGASVYPREVVKIALKHNAAAMIFAHNHPSGVAEPSAADRDITKRLVEALGLIDVRVLDHVVVGEGESVSFSEQGLL